MGNFIRFLSESATNTEFLIGLKTPLLDPEGKEVDTSEKYMYDMLTERIKLFPDPTTELKKIPYLPTFIKNIKNYLKDGVKIPYWDIAKKQIFLIDNNYNTSYAKTPEEITLGKEYRLFMIFALTSLQGQIDEKRAKIMVNTTIPIQN